MEKSYDIKFTTTVLIENYNRETKQYSLGKQEILEPSFDQIKPILEEIDNKSQLEDFPIKILVNKSLHLYYGRNYNRRYEITSSGTPQKYVIEPKNHINKWYPVEKEVSISEIEDFWSKEKVFSLKLKQIIRAQINILSDFFYPLVALFSYVFIYLINLKYLNLYFLIFWTWLVYLSLIDIIISILKLRSSGVKDFLYFIPFVRDFQPYNLSRFFFRATISWSAVILIGIALLDPELRMEFLLLFPLLQYLLPVLTLTVIIISTYTEGLKYGEHKNKRAKKLRGLTNFIHNEDLKENSKQFYLQLLIEVRNKPQVRIGYFSRFITILTFVLATLPAIAGAF